MPATSYFNSVNARPPSASCLSSASPVAIMDGEWETIPKRQPKSTPKQTPKRGDGGGRGRGRGAPASHSAKPKSPHAPGVVSKSQSHHMPKNSSPPVFRSSGSKAPRSPVAFVWPRISRERQGLARSRSHRTPIDSHVRSTLSALLTALSRALAGSWRSSCAETTIATEKRRSSAWRVVVVRKL